MTMNCEDTPIRIPVFWWALEEISVGVQEDDIPNTRRDRRRLEIILWIGICVLN